MIPRKRNGNGHGSALILLAADFREGRTVYCVERLRQAGISVSLVGLSAGLITGYHGMTLRPDVTLSQLPEAMNHKLVLIPDGKECISALFADPRVHQLIETTLENQGLVAAMPEAEAMLEQASLVTSGTAASFMWQKDRDFEGFVKELINCLD